MSKPRPIPASGRIDLHSHLLPGIDDGCRSIEDSIACVELLLAEGYVGTVCTPHLGPDLFSNTPTTVARAVAELQEQLLDAGIDYQLWTGGELRIAEDTVGWVEEMGVPVLGASNWVLVDYWGLTWPNYGDELCQYLFDRGYRVLLAHPERMQIEESYLPGVLQSLEQMGVRFQSNFNSMSGGEGPVAAQWVRKVLAEQRCDVMALDMHRPDTLSSRFDGIAAVEREFGRERLVELIETRPRSILENRP